LIIALNKYLFAKTGSDERESQPSGLIADRRSIVIDWKEEWADRMRRFQRRQFKGKCKSDSNV
jgi:netrin receptor unc-5